METSINKTKYVKKDRLLLIIVFSLVSLSLIMIYSASAIMALKNYGDSFYFLKKQIVWVFISVTAMLLTSRIDMDIWKRYSFLLIGFSYILLMLVLVPGIGSEINNARRWFRMGPISFQPSEFAKLSVIIYLASYLIRKGEKIQELSHGFLPPLLISGLIAGLIVMEPDFGAAFVIATGTGIMIFLAGARFIHISSLCLAVLPILVFLIKNMEYRWNRIKAFLNPWDDPSGAGYQIVQSFYSFGKGGLLGTGVGEGRQKLFFLPEAHTDFIFAVVGEELGFAGSVFVTLLFVFFLWRCLKIINKHWGSFEGYLATGITIFLGIQILINLFVVTGLFPTKGLALPFLSFGGTSLLTNMILVGILYAISGRSPVISQLEMNIYNRRFSRKMTNMLSLGR